MSKNEITHLALGCFDGMHMAHQKLFSLLGKSGGILVIDKGDTSLLSPRREEFTTLPIFYKALFKIKHLSACEFIDSLKLAFPKLTCLVVGYDFAFGKDAAAKANDIKKLTNLKAIIVPEVYIKGLSVHTKLIKNLLADAKIDLASCLLGRPYFIKGRRIKGQGLGSTKLLPTFNLDCKDYFLPKRGVWISLCEIENKLYQSVSFIGKRSTDKALSIETHLLESGFCKNPDEIKIVFKKYLRKPIDFNSLASLKEQILRDKADAICYFKDKNER